MNVPKFKKPIYLLWEYSSPIWGGYSSSQSTTSSSSRTTMWHSRSPRRALFTINGKIKSSKNTSNWQRAPSFDNSCSNPPTTTNFFKFKNPYKKKLIISYEFNSLSLSPLPFSLSPSSLSHSHTHSPFFFSFFSSYAHPRTHARTHARTQFS